MIEFSLSAAAEKLSARHIGPEGCFSAVSTDSRTIAAGDLFVAWWDRILMDMTILTLPLNAAHQVPWCNVQ